MTFVPPDGPVPARFIICGEAPGSEEVRQHRGFVGPSGKILWPVLHRLAMLDRYECYVTNLCKHPLDNSESGDAKISPEEFDACKASLHEELMGVAASVWDPDVTTHVLAVGALAARALMTDNYSRMEVHNGMTYRGFGPWTVTPCWHPAAALHGDTGKDPIAWMGDAMAHFGPGKERLVTGGLFIPNYSIGHKTCTGPIAIDTEGTPDDPQILTWSDGQVRYAVAPENAAKWWMTDALFARFLIFHNAPWDWSVLEAMGVPTPWRMPFQDTMELAYLQQTLPQGLKDLSRRFYDVSMPSWSDVVMPHYNEAILAIAAGRADAGTTIETHTKTGKLRKKPLIHRTDEAKALFRLLPNPEKGYVGNPDLLRTRIGDFPPPSLRFVPRSEMLEYATLDPFMTFKVWEKLR